MAQTEVIKKKIVIIGAGMAGLGAAHFLTKSNFSDYLILEALPEAGGRIKTIPFEKGVLELGAQWVHGVDTTLHKLALENNLIHPETSNEGEGLYIRDDGKILDDWLVRKVDFKVGQILEECENFVDAEFYPRSLGDYLEEKFSEFVDEWGDEEEKELLWELYDWHVRFQLIDNSCGNLRDLSAREWGRYSCLGKDGQAHINLKGGYGSLVDLLVCGLPKGNLILNVPVERIAIDSDGLLEIHTAVKGEMQSRERVVCGENQFIKNATQQKQNNTCLEEECKEIYLLNHVELKENESSNEINANANNLLQSNENDNKSLRILAEHIIITPSISVLQNNKKLLSFEKPEILKTAIQSMGFGGMGKVFLVFEKPWWNKSGYQLIFRRKKSGERKWVKHLSGFDPVLDQPNVLLGWVAAEGTEKMEALSEEQIGIDCVDMMRNFTRNEDIPYPVKVFKSNWMTCKWIGGGYSHTTPMCDWNNVGAETLTRPLYFSGVPRVVFAGEAAHPTHFSTTHGAFESGEEQAGKLLDYIQGH